LQTVQVQRSDPSQDRPDDTPSGAYGLTLRGVEQANGLLGPALETWPVMAIEREVGRREPGESYITAETARAAIHGGGAVELTLEPLRAVFRTPVPLDDETLVHPFLAPAAAIAGAWLDRTGWHAGGFLAGGGVWGVLGERGSGKSSTLALLALAGTVVVTDDLLVVEDGTVFAGPRSIDLRREVAAALGAGEPLGRVGARERWRLRLGPVEPALPLRGFVFLDWGDGPTITRLAPSARVERLGRESTLNVGGENHPRHYLDLVVLPAYELRRPHDWKLAGDSIAMLRDVTGAG
jgi:hypothetical protein